MTQTAINYARVLYELSVSPERIQEAEKIITETPQLLHTLESPVVPLSQKEKAIGRIFAKDLKNFMCVLCRYGHMGLLPEIFRVYQEYYNEQNHILSATLYYVIPPSKNQLEGIQKFLKKQYSTQDAELNLVEDKSLVGGFILRIKDQEFDYSLKGRINALKQKLVWR